MAQIATNNVRFELSKLPPLVQIINTYNSISASDFLKIDLLSYRLNIIGIRIFTQNNVSFDAYITTAEDIPPATTTLENLGTSLQLLVNNNLNTWYLKTLENPQQNDLDDLFIYIVNPSAPTGAITVELLFENYTPRQLAEYWHCN